jgi:hypothetical protein
MAHGIFGTHLVRVLAAGESTTTCCSKECYSLYVQQSTSPLVTAQHIHLLLVPDVFMGSMSTVMSPYSNIISFNFLVKTHCCCINEFFFTGRFRLQQSPSSTVLCHLVLCIVTAEVYKDMTKYCNRNFHTVGLSKFSSWLAKCHRLMQTAENASFYTRS